MVQPPSPELLTALQRYDRAVADLTLAVREMILEEAPDARESLYAKTGVELWFGLETNKKDWFCCITVYATHVNLVFLYGVELQDPGRVLQGAGKRTRYVKITNRQDLERPGVRRVLRAAIERM